MSPTLKTTGLGGDVSLPLSDAGTQGVWERGRTVGVSPIPSRDAGYDLCLSF